MAFEMDPCSSMCASRDTGKVFISEMAMGASVSGPHAGIKTFSKCILTGLGSATFAIGRGVVGNPAGNIWKVYAISSQEWKRCGMAQLIK